MNSRTFRLSGFLLVALLLAGCGATGRWMGTTGEGTVGAAQWTGAKCQAILDWIEIFKKEYPDLDLTRAPRGYQSFPEAANLFRDAYFVPVFGFAYNGYNAGKAQVLNQEVIASCMGWGKYRNMHYQPLFFPLKPFFDSTFAHHNAALDALAREYTQRAETMDAAAADDFRIHQERIYCPAERASRWPRRDCPAGTALVSDIPAAL